MNHSVLIDRVVHHRAVHHLVADQPAHPGSNEEESKRVRTEVVIVYAPEIQRE